MAGVALGLRRRRLAWPCGDASIYVASYHFPSLEYVITPSVFVQAAAVQLGAALVGGFGSLRKAVLLPPAVAMRPPPPPVYKRTLIERLGPAPVRRPADADDPAAHAALARCGPG